MNTKALKSVYFVGAGGIGMSALVRYFLTKGYNVGGYDKTPSELTEKLIEEGAKIHYEENVEAIDACFKDKDSTLVVYTPAIPAEHKEMVYFREQGFDIAWLELTERPPHRRWQLICCIRVRWTAMHSWVASPRTMERIIS